MTMTAVKERPFLLNGAMVLETLALRKRQSRRPVKFNQVGRVQLHGKQWHIEDPNAILACPYGQPGDRLWVRETWAHIDDYTGSDPGTRALLDRCFYRADYPKGDVLDDELTRWRPSIHMPRWASRITLEITGVRVERVQEISEADAEAEGVEASTFDGGQSFEYRLNFPDLWDSINAKRGFGWDANPLVWVIEFKVLQPGPNGRERNE